jgi:hypothetical protein
MANLIHLAKRVPLLIALISSLLWGIAAASPHQTSSSCPAVDNTPFFTIVYGTVTLNGSRAAAGTVVEARNPRGDTVGCFEITTEGNFGAMYVFGEDNSVTPPIPGMRNGETILFFVDWISAAASPALTWSNDQDLHQVSLSASGNTVTPSITPTSTDTPTPTSTNTATPTPTNTATPTPTNTATPAAIENRIYLPAILK